MAKTARKSAATTEPTPERPAEARAPGGKLGVVASMLQAPGGATIEQLSAATGWQAHSVRGALAGTLKKRHGLTIVSEKTEAGRIYRVAAEAGA